MKKNIYQILFLTGALLAFATFSTSAKDSSLSQTLCQAVPVKLEQNYQQQQLIHFFENIARQDPAAFATFLLGEKSIYLTNPEVAYIGVKPNGEVLVLCEIDDFEIGAFYHVLHKKDGKVTTQSVATAPRLQEFITLFKRAS